MNKKIIPLAVLAILSTASYAQSGSNIAISGLIDTSVGVANNGAARTTLLSSGIKEGSGISFRGTEDLGGGLKAIFRLEAGFEADTGLQKNTPNISNATAASPGGPSGPGLFNKHSYIGLAGDFGIVKFGRDYTPLRDAARDSDPLMLGFWGNAAEGANLSGTGTDRFASVSNGIFYQSPHMAGFIARAMYSLGSESSGSAGAPPSDANRMWALGAHYVNSGLLITGAYQVLKLPTVAGSPAAFTGATRTRKDMIIGAKYTFGNYSVSGGYMMLKQPIPTNDGKYGYLGGTAKIGIGTAMLEVSRIRQNTAVARTANVFGLAYLYPLSKRTALYGSHGQLKNSATASFALVAADPSVAPAAPGATVKATSFGIIHKF